MPWGAVVIEASPLGLYKAPRYGRITPAHAIGTLLRWSGVYRVPVWFADNRTVARAMVKAYLRLAWEEAGKPKHDKPACPCGGGAVVAHDPRWTDHV